MQHQATRKVSQRRMNQSQANLHHLQRNQPEGPNRNCRRADSKFRDQRNHTATADKFPRRILTETFDAGFATALLTKDVNLFVDNAREAGTPTKIAEAITEVWDKTNDALPGSDITMVYRYLRDEA